MTDKKYSLNDEDYIYDNIREVIDALESEGEFIVGSTYYEVDCRPLVANDLVNSVQILESFDDQLYEEIGEGADRVFYNLPKEAHNELEELLVAFINKHSVLDGYWKAVGMPRKLKITEDDVK